MFVSEEKKGRKATFQDKYIYTESCFIYICLKNNALKLFSINSSSVLQDLFKFCSDIYIKMLYFSDCL